MGFCGELLANALGGSLSPLLGSSVGGERTLGRVFGDRAAFTGGGRGRWHSAAVERLSCLNPYPPVAVVWSATGSSYWASSAPTGLRRYRLVPSARRVARPWSRALRAAAANGALYAPVSRTGGAARPLDDPIPFP